MPASGVPASGAPAAGGYTPALTYPTAPYPTAPYPGSGFPNAPAGPGVVGKKRSASMVTFAILSVVFLLIAGGMTALYVTTKSDLSTAKKNSAATAAADKTKISNLQGQLKSANEAAAAAKQESDGEITNLKSKVKLYQSCVNDADAVIRARTNAALGSALGKMFKTCEIAKAES